MTALLQWMMDNPIPTVLVLVGIVLFFAIVNSPEGEWIQIGRKLGVVIGGLILLAVIFGLVLARTIS